MNDLYSGDIKKVRQAIQDGANVNQQNRDGNTPLHIASLRKNSNITELLLDKGANVNVKDQYGNTPLYNACFKNNKGNAELLIKNGADVNLQGNNGKKPFEVKNNDTCKYVETVSKKDMIEESLKGILDKVDNREKAFSSNMEETKQEQEKPKMTHRRKM